MNVTTVTNTYSGSRTTTTIAPAGNHDRVRPLSIAGLAVDRRKDCPRNCLSSDAEATLVPAMILMLRPCLGRQGGKALAPSQATNQ